MNVKPTKTTYTQQYRQTFGCYDEVLTRTAPAGHPQRCRRSRQGEVEGVRTGDELHRCEVNAGRP